MGKLQQKRKEGDKVVGVGTGLPLCPNKVRGERKRRLLNGVWNNESSCWLSISLNIAVDKPHVPPKSNQTKRVENTATDKEVEPNNGPQTIKDRAEHSREKNMDI
jgi:hypothetical protein